jgi:hypothetical protein
MRYLLLIMRFDESVFSQYFVQAKKADRELRQLGPSSFPGLHAGSV